MLTHDQELEQWGPVDARILYMSFWFLLTAGLVSIGTGIFWPDLVGVYEHEQITFYWNQKEMLKRGEKALRLWIIPKARRKKLWDRYLKNVAQLKKISKKLEVRLAGDPSIKDLRTVAEEWAKHLIEFWKITLIPELGNFAAPEFLLQRIKTRVPAQKASQVLESLLAPESLSFHQLSELDFFKAFAAAKTQNELARKLKKHSRRWFWVENSYYESKVLEPKNFISQFKRPTRTQALKKMREIENYSSAIRKKKQQLAKKYRLPKSLLDKARSLSFSIWWQDHRKGVAWWAHSITDRFNDMLSEHLNLSYDDLMHYDAEEWQRIFTTGKKVSRKILENRKKLIVVDIADKRYKYYYGKKVLDIAQKLKPSVVKQKNSQLSGIVASAGKNPRLKGRVKVLLTSRLSSQMKPGQVLVAPMTTPDYIWAMRKAKAIVTDVGGLMSHAAVVSRELGVPCIVGTKIATKVLKDGDLVEIDAKLGIVKKL